MRLMSSVISSGPSVSLLTETTITGSASESACATTGSSISAGRRPRTRATRSRTSLAATSGFFSSLKRTLISLRPARVADSITSMPSMPAMESSSGLVTCDSITSAEAPR